MADPVSWMMIERGWEVRDARGKEIGKVGEVTGDENADIFDGLTLSGGIFGHDRYVPAERVSAIRMGVVTLDIAGAAVEKLARFDEPAPEEQVLPESSTWYQRLAWWLTGRNR